MDAPVERASRLLKPSLGLRLMRSSLADLAFLLRKEQPEQRRLSRAAIETLAIIAYHQPVTRAEIGDLFWRTPIQGGLQCLRHDGVIAHPGIDAPQVAAGVDGARPSTCRGGAGSTATRPRRRSA